MILIYPPAHVLAGFVGKPHGKRGRITEVIAMTKFSDRAPDDKAGIVGVFHLRIANLHTGPDRPKSGLTPLGYDRQALDEDYRFALANHKTCRRITTAGRQLDYPLVC
jgi:hypothetical protein